MIIIPLIHHKYYVKCSFPTNRKSPKTTTQTDDAITKEPPIGTHALPHPIWSPEELHSVEVTHKKPSGLVDRVRI